MISKEKQIEEMSRILASDCGKCTKCDHFHKEINGIDSCYFKYADMLYNAGYRKQSEWISVDERLPKVGESVLGYAENINECFVVAYSNTYRTFFTGQFPNEDITHWMPLPEAPKMKGGAE